MSDMNHESEWVYDQAANFLKPGMFAIDIGANTGVPYTVMFLERVAPNGLVWSFEPGPAEYKILQQHRSSSVKFIPWNVALSDDEEEKDVYHYQYWSLIDQGIDGVKEQHSKDTNREFFRCTFRRLDHFKLPQKVDLMKIDVDGQEARVLRGAEKVIAEHKPVIAIELGHFVARYFGESIERMVGHLIDMGYIGSCYDMHNVDDASAIANRTPDESTVDFIFIPR